MRPLLWHIVVSHYSEKVRWALEHKRVEHARRAPLPGVHMPVALALTRGGVPTLPVLELDGRRIGDSTQIIAALEARHPDPPLYPAGAADRARALALEDYFDEALGPNIRRFVFHELSQDPDTFVAVGAQAVPVLFERIPAIAGAYARTLVRLRYDAGRRSAADRARAATLAAFDRLESELGGRRYLVGDCFSVADLTAAAMFYPLVLPSEGPIHLDEVPAPLAQVREQLRGRPGWAYVEELYRRHRRG